MKSALFLFAVVLTSWPFEVHQINVGQGSATLIRCTESRGVLVDAGPNRADNRLLGYLDSIGIDTLSAIVLTHPDADHIGEVRDLVQSGGCIVQRVIKNSDTASTATYANMMAALSGAGVSVEVLNAESLILDDSIHVYHFYSAGTDENRHSLVVWFQDQGKKGLIMGDADTIAERSYYFLMADLLVVGHHGSNGSTSATFLDTIGPPEVAVIPVGNNSYGHPTPEVVGRLIQDGVMVFRTDLDGNVVISFEGGDMVVHVDVEKSPKASPAVSCFLPRINGTFNVLGQRVDGALRVNGVFLRNNSKILFTK